MSANKKLILMRHAKSSWKFPELSDHQRPLNKRGIRDAPRMGSFLQKSDYIPDLILVSNAKRTLQTLELLGKHFQDIPKKIISNLYDATLEDLLSEIHQIPIGKTAMIIGHNPGLEILIDRLTKENHIMPTASVAIVEQKKQKWMVREILKPKEIFAN